MHWTTYRLWMGMAMLFWAALASCSPGEQQSSPYFSAFFPSPQFDFRNVRLGMPLDSVKQAESAQLVSEDLLGLAYTIAEQDLELPVEVEYYFPEDREKDALVSIVANLRFEDPSKAELIYRECREYFIKKYGLPVADGLGKVSWQERRQHGLVETHLRLSELEAVFSINILLVAGK